MNRQILKLNKAGQALRWINLEQAANLYAREQIVWSFGDDSYQLMGGINRNSGKRSFIELAPVIAVDGIVHKDDTRTPTLTLTNRALFARDGNLCTYCGKLFDARLLTRDHIIPKGQGGKDIWTNVTSSCKRCNNYKGCRTPEQAGISLLCVPYKPNRAEYLALSNRKNILSDQMEFLRKSFSRNMIVST